MRTLLCADLERLPIEFKNAILYLSARDYFEMIAVRV